MFEAQTTNSQSLIRAMNFHQFGPLKILRPAPFPTWNILDLGHVCWGWLDLCPAPPCRAGGAVLGVNSLEVTGCDCLICGCHPSGKNPCLWAADYPQAHYNIVPKQIPQASACNHFYIRVGKYPSIRVRRWGWSRSRVINGRRDAATTPWTVAGNHQYWPLVKFQIRFDFPENQ